MRGTAWVEMFLLLFGEEVFFGFGWVLLIWVAMRRRHTPPAPLKRGALGCLFLFDI